MSVSPPPASILASSVNTIPAKAPGDLGTNISQNVWQQIVNEIDIAGPALTPVPYIDKAHFFDLLNVFAEVNEPMLDKVKSTITKSKRYKYVGRLKSLVKFMTDNNEKISDIVQLRDQTPVTSLDHIEHILKGVQDNVECDYKLHIENPRVHAFHFKMDPKIAVGIDRALPGMDSPTALLIISEVFSGSRVSVISQGSKQKAIQYIPPNDPIPLAFAALRVEVNNNGVFKSPPHVMPQSNLVGLKHWIFIDGKSPAQSPCIKTLTKGLIYNMDKNSANSQVPAKDHKMPKIHGSG